MMTIAEYEAIRAHSTHFGVVPQHEQPEIESVIEPRATSSSRSAKRMLRSCARNRSAGVACFDDGARGQGTAAPRSRLVRARSRSLRAAFC
jgi:hypothetical protein